MIEPLITTITNTSSTPPEITTLDVIIQIAPLFLFAFGIIAMRIWHMLGGWPEAWYKITRTPYFVAWFIMPNKEPDRQVFKQDIITRNSPAQFEYRKGHYLIDEKGPAGMTSSGRQAFLYNWDEGEPIPVFAWKDPSKRFDPKLLWTAFKTKIVQEMHVLGEPALPPPGKALPVIKTIVFVALIVFAVFAAYYSLNTYCALAPAKCGNGFFP